MYLWSSRLPCKLSITSAKHAAATDMPPFPSPTFLPADPPAGAIYIQPNDNRDLHVFADTVTLLPDASGAGVFSKRGDSKANSGQSGLAGQDGKSVKITARSLLCGGGLARCKIDTSGG